MLLLKKGLAKTAVEATEQKGWGLPQGTPSWPARACLWHSMPLPDGLHFQHLCLQHHVACHLLPFLSFLERTVDISRESDGIPRADHCCSGTGPKPGLGPLRQGESEVSGPPPFQLVFEQQIDQQLVSGMLPEEYHSSIPLQGQNG